MSSGIRDDGRWLPVGDIEGEGVLPRSLEEFLKNLDRYFCLVSGLFGDLSSHRTALIGPGEALVSIPDIYPDPQTFQEALQVGATVSSALIGNGLCDSTIFHTAIHHARVMLDTRRPINEQGATGQFKLDGSDQILGNDKLYGLSYSSLQVVFGKGGEGSLEYEFFVRQSHVSAINSIDHLYPGIQPPTQIDPLMRKILTGMDLEKMVNRLRLNQPFPGRECVAPLLQHCSHEYVEIIPSTWKRSSRKRHTVRADSKGPFLVPNMWEGDEADIVRIDWSDVIKLLNTDQYYGSQVFNQVVLPTMGIFPMDDGQPYIGQLQLLKHMRRLDPQINRLPLLPYLGENVYERRVRPHDTQRARYEAWHN